VEERKREQNPREPAFSARQRSMAARTSATRKKIDSILDSFSVDQVPAFSRTVLISSPVLLTLHLESGDAVPLPHVAVGTSSLASGNSSVKPSLVRTCTGSMTHESTPLPKSLHSLLRDHKRAAFDLFRRWEDNGKRTVPLGVLAEGVRHLCNVELSNEELMQVLKAVEPTQGGATPDAKFRSRLIDTQRLWRRLQAASSRLAHQYIQEQNQPFKAVAGGSIPPRASWASMLEERLGTPASVDDDESTTVT